MTLCCVCLKELARGSNAAWAEKTEEGQIAQWFFHHDCCDKGSGRPAVCATSKPSRVVEPRHPSNGAFAGMLS